MPKPTITRHAKNKSAPRLAMILGAFCLIVVLAACGGGYSASSGASTSTTAASTPTTAASTPTDSATNTPTVTPTPLPGLTQVVMITDMSNGSFGFSPASIAIEAGATVIWKNVSSAPHTVTSDDGQTFDSGNVQPGGTFKFTFKTAGSFSYHCNIHPYMRAVIIVV
jgi:plastocyanin